MRLALAYLGAEAVPVAVPPDVHPVPRPTLAVSRAGQKPFDDISIRLFGRVSRKSGDFLGAGKQPDQVEVDTADQRRRVGGWSGFEPVLFVLGGDEGIDRVLDPGGLSADGRSGRDVGASKGLKGPVVAWVRLVLFVGGRLAPCLIHVPSLATSSAESGGPSLSGGIRKPSRPVTTSMSRLFSP